MKASALREVRGPASGGDAAPEDRESVTAGIVEPMYFSRRGVKFRDPSGSGPGCMLYLTLLGGATGAVLFVG